MRKLGGRNKLGWASLHWPAAMEESFHGENDKKDQKLMVGQNLCWMYEKFDNLSARVDPKIWNICV